MLARAGALNHPWHLALQGLVPALKNPIYLSGRNLRFVGPLSEGCIELVTCQLDFATCSDAMALQHAAMTRHVVNQAL